MISIDQGINSIKGIGDKTAALFAKLGITRVGDLIGYYPRTYEQYPPVYESVEDAMLQRNNPALSEEACDYSSELSGDRIAIYGMIVGAPSLRRVRALTILNFTIGTRQGQIGAVIYNMPYLKNALKSASKHVFYGRVVKTNTGYRMEQPAMFSLEDYKELSGKMLPKYPLTKGLSNKTIQNALEKVFAGGIQLIDPVPMDLSARFQIMAYEEAVYHIHFPKNMDEFTKARNSLVFREFLCFLIQTRSTREAVTVQKSEYPMIRVSDCERLIEHLPYKLTGAQNRAYQDIAKALEAGFVSNRLIQGDVGSGKTIVAILSLLMACANGYQGAMMAPTEVLARQHYLGISKITRDYGLCLRPVLLTGSLTAKEKKEALAQIQDGTCNLVIGTQALIQEGVEFHKLALVITDEQHRFGVIQRETLAKKGAKPHILVMSATPIPRTLAMLLFGDMNVTVIDEYPSTHIPVKTCVMPSSKRGSAVSFILKEIEKGHQAYIICPMALESEDDQLSDATTYAEKLREHIPERIRCQTLHGKMKNDEKRRIMDAFSKGDIDILVSTTVVEVGVDVPNATVIMIENSERFGLASLHQLRGRVGRGKDTSYCIFLQGNDSEKASKRLKILNDTNDGFKVAKQDMELRGPGDIFGIRQSGVMAFKLGDIYQDSELLMEASKAYEELAKDKKQLSNVLEEFLKSGFQMIDYMSM